MKKFSKDLETLFYEQKILPIVNSKNLSDDIKIIESLLNSNKSIKCIEITLREENSFINAIKLKEKFSHIHFGLGSILNLEILEKSTNENFDFYASPGLIPEIISKNLNNYIPGAETVSDFNFLYNEGFNLIKFFPATISGGPAKIKAVQNIYKNLKFIPTGGLNKLNMNEYLNLANVLCVGMSKFN